MKLHFSTYIVPKYNFILKALESIYKIEKDKTLISGNVVVEYEGEINSPISDSLIGKIEKELDKEDLSLKLKKKLFKISVETLQNLSHYSIILNNADTKYQNIVFKIINSSNLISILSGNYIRNDHVKSLRNRLLMVRDMTKDELGKLYRGVLEVNSTSESGGAGLGFIDIARKSNKEFDYHIIEVDNDFCFFVLIVNIQK